MLIVLVLLSVMAAVWWGMQVLSPAQRGLRRFIYSTGMGPAALNGGFPGDDVTGEFAGDPGEWPTVTVIVPGRNEGHLLEKTLGSLCGMEYPGYRVVFVNDQSTDNTEEVCARLAGRHGHLTVIHNKESPREGWNGKTWAVHQAEPHMHEAEYLLFTDSDLEFHPECLRQMIRLARHRRTDVASLLPAMYCETAGELLGLLSAMCIVNSRLSLYHTNDPTIARALVAGGFLLVRRETYHELGGHAAVRGQVVEDVAFGTRAKALKKRVFTALTHDLYRARMYEGWGDTYRGLKKNAYAGANYSLIFGGFIAGFLFFLGVMPPVYAVLGVYCAVAFPSGLATAAAVAGVGAFLLQVLSAAGTARFVGFPARVAWLVAPGFAFYLAVFVGSVVDYYRGGNTWAGRQVKNAQSLKRAGETSERV